MSRYVDRLQLMTDDEFRAECKYVVLGAREVGGHFKMDVWECCNEAHRRSKPELFEDGRDEALAELEERRKGPTTTKT